MEPAEVFFIRGVPRATKNAFKAACAKKRVSMSQQIVALMQQFVRTEEGQAKYANAKREGARERAARDGAEK